MSKIQVDTIVNKLDNGSPSFPFGITATGVVTATGINATGVVTATGGIRGVGIYSGGIEVTTGVVTSLNFVGSGNTFNVVGNRVDVSISGGAGRGFSGISGYILSI